MRKLIIAVMSVALVAGAFAAPVVGSDDSDQTSVAAAGYPPNPNFREVPFVQEQGANQEWYYEQRVGGIPDCDKTLVDGGFTNVNRFDNVFSKYTKPEPTLRHWQPAPPMWSGPGSTVWKMNCRDLTPGPSKAYVSLSPQIYFCGGNEFWFEVKNVGTRPGMVTTRWVKPNGKVKKVEWLEVPPLMVWRDRVKVDPDSDQDMWVHVKANEWVPEAYFGVRRAPDETKKTPNKCSGLSEGMFWY